jgi:hypothetical protein
MTFQDTLQDLILRLGEGDGGILAWEQVREWPGGAVEIFELAGWIKLKDPARAVVCPGCEENCFMPVHVRSETEGKSLWAYVACDKRDDMGRVPLSTEHLKQWQISEGQVAKWICHALGLKGRPKRTNSNQAIQLGHFQGKKRTGILELDCTRSPVLKSSGGSIPLEEIVVFNGKQLNIDREAVLEVVDRPPPVERYSPSVTRRESRKLNTQNMHKSWQKTYRKLKRENPGMSDKWYSQKISKMDIAQGRDPETIRKNMKK